MRILALALTFALIASAASAQDMSYGEAEFLVSCAACHGDYGTGDGPLASELRTRPADLTRLAERNGGEFPYSRVFQVIDGRSLVPSHGEREMPVWGRQFIEQDVEDYGTLTGEAVTKERVHELTEYVRSLQR